MNKKLLMATASLLVICGCSSVQTSSSAEASVFSESMTSVSSADYESSVSSSETSLESSSHEMTTLSTNPVTTGISLGGVFLDTDVGRWLCVGVTYEGTYNFTDGFSHTAVIKNSNPENIEIVKKEASNTLVFTAKQAGDTILTIYDEDEIIHYRAVISARDRIEEKDVFDFLIDVDHFQAWGVNGDSKITFISDDTAIYSGYDGTTYLGDLTFTYELSGSNIYSDDEYSFNITDWPDNASGLICTKFNLDYTGCFIHLMTPNITLDVYTPVYL